MKTISLADQLRASDALYMAALEDIESIESDVELARVLSFAGYSALARVLSFASDSTLARVLSVTSDSALDRVVSVISGSTLARVLSFASDSALDRVVSVISDSALARVLSFASDSALARVLSVTSASTLDRVVSVISGSALDRIRALCSLRVPVVPDLDKRMAEAVKEHGLDMSKWHCGTTRCRAGWAITLAGPDGAALEEAVGAEMAGRLIYEASTGRIAPDFFASTESALEDIKRCAQLAQGA